MGPTLVVDALRGMFLGPMVIASGEHQSEKDLRSSRSLQRRGTGVGILLAHPDGGIGRAKQVSVWLSERSPHWNLEMHNVNPPVLTGHLLELGRPRTSCAPSFAQLMTGGCQCISSATDRPRSIVQAHEALRFRRRVHGCAEGEPLRRSPYLRALNDRRDAASLQDS